MERLGLVPSHVREFVIERDGSMCRVCGTYIEQPALHHIRFRSQGGLDVPSNLITIGWTPVDCNHHLTVAHGPDALRWREIFLLVAQHPGVTAFQAARWGQAAAGAPRGPGRR